MTVLVASASISQAAVQAYTVATNVILPLLTGQ